MKLVMIYGPPAVGKLTVAKALQEATGFRLLHNHLFTDICDAVFEKFGTQARTELNLQLRTDVIRATAKDGALGMIFTFSYYAGPLREAADHAVRTYIRVIKELQGEIYFVKLSCDMPELEKRVKNSSRAGTRKITDIEKLRRVLQEERPAEIPLQIAESYTIDNTHLSPKVVATMIKDYTIRPQ
ncbi:MAG: AAA family ATPase [bacterium]|nr:AAA family ATPase [bacterium]